MIWFLIWIGTWLISFFLYAKRYTSNKVFYGFSFVQFFYLVATMPITALCLLNIGFDVTKNPEVINIPISTEVLLSFYILSILVGAIGGSIHASSTSLAEQLKNHIFLNAYSVNEEFHGPVSHDLIFLSITGVTLFLGLLGLNHPSAIPINPTLPLYGGIIIGLLNGLTVVRSTHVGLSLITSFFTTLFLGLIIQNSSLHLINYPFLVFAVVNAFVIFITLLISILIYFKSKRMTKIMVKIIFPKGHPIHQTFSIF